MLWEIKLATRVIAETEAKDTRCRRANGSDHRGSEPLLVRLVEPDRKLVGSTSCRIQEFRSKIIDLKRNAFFAAKFSCITIP